MTGQNTRACVEHRCLVATNNEAQLVPALKAPPRRLPAEFLYFRVYPRLPIRCEFGLLARMPNSETLRREERE